MRTSRFLLATTATASLLLVTGCGSDDAASIDATILDEVTGTTAGAMVDAGTAAGAGTGASIGLSSSRFEPADVEIAVGGTVTFTNNDPFAHTITSNDDSTIEYDSGEFNEGETFEQTYDEVGTYGFFCQIHPTMRGTVTVS